MPQDPVGRPGPLAGIKVLDLTSVVVGPAATLRLADLGADVIKVEPPEGDLLRTLGGPSPSGRMSGKFMHFNRGKRFVALDLRKPGGLAALKRMVQGCDVLVSNMRPDALGRLGLDAKSCRAEKPDLIHCLITGFGPGGPYRGKPAYDTVLQAAAGIAGLSIERDGAPSFAPFLAVDHVVGEIAAGVVSAALVQRFRTGTGASIEIPMLETMAAFVLKEHLGPATFEPPLGPPGDRRVLDPAARPVRTKDGWIAITANTDAHARAFLRGIGREELLHDERFSTVAARVRNTNAWFTLREEALIKETTAHWVEVFSALDVPAMPCRDLATLTDDPHIAAVRLVRPLDHPTEGAIRSVRPTILFDDAVQGATAPAQPLGKDTLRTLEEFAFAREEIDALLASGAAVAQGT
ncbi:MAG TPA: CoA transferase [Xanthobacteraceae bacterium]|nr:CoA transferase [Xanthobacteraceae bacterium]